MSGFTQAKIAGTGVDPDKYHAGKSVADRGKRDYPMSQGELKEFARCPSRWRAGYERSGDTTSTLWGGLIDCLALTPAMFPLKYAVAPKTYVADGKRKGDPPEEKAWNWNATICKAWRDDQGEKTVIKDADKAEADAAVKRLLTDARISTLIDASDRQMAVEAVWHDDVTGLDIPCKALLDLAPKSTNKEYADALADLKTSMSADVTAWQRQVFGMGYHIQAGFYLDIYNAATKQKRSQFLHVVQENFAPFETARRRLSSEFLQIGRDRYKCAIQLYAQCLKTDVWPSYDDGENVRAIDGWTVTDPPPWAMTQIGDFSEPTTVAESLNNAGL